MLTENDVIDAVCAELSRHGWIIKSTATTRQRGDDIVAQKDGRTLIVEAKGATSSKPGSARHGVEFNGGQVHSHVAVAVLRALRVASIGVARAGLAFPDNLHHRRELESVKPALDQLGITVFWVGSVHSVKVQTAVAL